jgi:hypothetical protein
MPARASETLPPPEAPPAHPLPSPPCTAARHPQDLSLASSGGITTCHLASLSALTGLRMTATAPLAPALAPLAALTALVALHLRCISPCGSWGAAIGPVLAAAAGSLTQLQVGAGGRAGRRGCRPRHRHPRHTPAPYNPRCTPCTPHNPLPDPRPSTSTPPSSQINFATLEEDDVACFKAAPRLRVLDLTSCRWGAGPGWAHCARGPVGDSWLSSRPVPFLRAMSLAVHARPKRACPALVPASDGIRPGAPPLPKAASSPASSPDPPPAATTPRKTPARRHLTPGCFKHIAGLTALTSLRLEHTGLILAHPHLKLLGSGRQLAELSVDSLDLCALRQEDERARALLAARAAAAPAPSLSPSDAGAGGAPASALTSASASLDAVSAGGDVSGLPLETLQRIVDTGPAARWPPLRSVHLHSTSSYLNLQSLLRFAPGLRHLTLMHYVRWDEGERAWGGGGGAAARRRWAAGCRGRGGREGSPARAVGVGGLRPLAAAGRVGTPGAADYGAFWLIGSSPLHRPLPTAVGLIASCGAGLESLHISGFSGLTTEGFAALASMPRLRRLVFRNAWLSADRVAPLAAAAAGAAMRPLATPPAGAVGTAAAAEAAGGGYARAEAQRLESLRLEHCTGVDSATAAVLAALPWLRSLALRDCPDLGEPAVLALASAPRLTRLEISNCAKVRPSARAAARRARAAACDAAAAAAQVEGLARCGGGAGGGGCASGQGVLGAPSWPWPVLPDRVIDVVWDGGGTSSGEGGSW